MATDDKRQQTLDIPNGTIFEFKDGKLVFGHESDFVIRTNMGGYKFQKIFSRRGNVQILPPPGVDFDVDEIEAPAGDVFINGSVKARVVRGKTVHFQEGRLAAEVIEAKEEVVLGGEKLNVLLVRAPRVVVDADSEGMVLVVESQNDIGRCKARGGFRSVAEAREALEQFRRIAGDRGAGESPAGGTSAPLSMPAAPMSAAPAAAAVAEPVEDASATSPGFPVIASAAGDTISPDTTALPKSSVFRKRT